jgi:hypothetical protein
MIERMCIKDHYSAVDKPSSLPSSRRKQSPCVCVVAFQCPAKVDIDNFFGQKLDLIVSVRGIWPIMTRPTSVLTNPTKFFRANFSSEFRSLTTGQSVSDRVYTLYHRPSSYSTYLCVHHAKPAAEASGSIRVLLEHNRDSMGIHYSSDTIRIKISSESFASTTNQGVASTDYCYWKRDSSKSRSALRGSLQASIGGVPS